MEDRFKILKPAYKSYINNLIEKRINIVVPISVFLLILLMFLDIYVRKSTIAVYTRLPSLIIAFSLIILNKRKTKNNKSFLTVLYNVFLVSIYLMMFAKFLVHINDNSATANVIGLIVAIFIISLELRTSLLNTILIYLLPLIIFIIIFYLFFSPYFNEDLYTPLLNVLLFIVIGFTINNIQNNFRFKTFNANYLLDIEKDKLSRMNNKLEELVEEKTKSLSVALEKAKESDNLKTAFLQNISHEIRTPLNAVEGFMQILSKKHSNIRREYNYIKENFIVLTKIIDNIIFLSELQTNKTKINKKDINAEEFINELFNILKKEIVSKSKKVKPILEFNNSENFVFNADKKLLIKAITFIIDNAVKFSEDGEIKLICNNDNNKTNIIIKDNGQGISKEDLPHVFDFFRKFEDENKFHRGLGIGLSIAQGLINIHSGEIKVKSEIGEGTSIKFCF